METIRILQKTYENLHVLSAPIALFLREQLPPLSPNWKKEFVFDILNDPKEENDKTLSYYERKRREKKEINKELEELDVYYLLKILTNYKVWNRLIETYPDNPILTNENKVLLSDIKDIRNEVAHPSLQKHTMDEYALWTDTISKGAELFGFELNGLINELHQAEKEKLLNIVLSKVVNPALAHSGIKDHIRASIENTKDRLLMQNTSEGIIYFFTDALHATGGKHICEKLHECGLLAFEDIYDEVMNAYYG